MVIALNRLLATSLIVRHGTSGRFADRSWEPGGSLGTPACSSRTRRGVPGVAGKHQASLLGAAGVRSSSLASWAGSIGRPEGYVATAAISFWKACGGAAARGPRPALPHPFIPGTIHRDGRPWPGPGRAATPGCGRGGGEGDGAHNPLGHPAPGDGAPGSEPKRHAQSLRRGLRAGGPGSGSTKISQKSM
jgi:hypothetical protein